MSNGFRLPATAYTCEIECAVTFNQPGRVVLPHMLDSQLFYFTATKTQPTMIVTEAPFVYVGTHINLIGT